ncbi:MAG: phosphoribosyltransferase [Nanohaloarchaea archaeon]|nr:phosphoribosyltransferase [Candidatus Nanohaloarchaea archaeon]
MTVGDEGNHIYRIAESEFYENPAKIFSLDYYTRENGGEDEFSRKQIWFQVYGDEEIEKEFNKRLTRLFQQHFNNGDWDFVTMYPTHVKGEVNPHMKKLIEDIAEDLDLEYSQVLRRNETIEENHELESPRKKIVNVEGTVDITEDVEGKNVIVVDNIAISGTSLLHATNRLYEAGAKKVASVTLGVSKEHREDDMFIENDASAKKIMKKTTSEGS